LSIGTLTFTPELAKEWRWGGASPLTIENLLEAHERAGIDLCVVSNTIHYLRDKTAEESLAFLVAGMTTEPRSNSSIKDGSSSLPAQ
jgi:hypothetical protein